MIGRFPQIVPVFKAESGYLYSEITRSIVQSVFVESEFNSLEISGLDDALPLITTQPCDKAGGDFSFYAITKHRPGAFKFFCDMLVNWLVPGKRLNSELIFSPDFHISDKSSARYTLCHVMLRVETESELQEIQVNFNKILPELKLGLESKHHARRILEIKGLSPEAKTAMIQEHIIYVINRLSQKVDYAVLTEMQHVLVLCSAEFKAMRSSEHLSRMIITQYLFRKNGHLEVASHPEKRHLYLKLFREKIQHPGGDKKILGLVVGMSLLKDKEIFDQRHILTALQAFVPSLRFVPGSFITNRHNDDQFLTLYLEVEKEDGSAVTTEELGAMKRDLADELKSQISYVMHPVFMPRNEKEVMRNIFSLSAQIKFIRDIPQLFISFDEQTQHHLFFTVIAVRVVSPGSSSIQEMFIESETTLEYIHDRCKSVGILRKKYAKEVTVFRVKLLKENFLRRDQTIDLYKARQEVVYQLMLILGDFRDFNGGMITKQTELLDLVKKQLVDLNSSFEVLLENFFYSLTPVVMRTILEPEALKQLFLMQLELLKRPFSKNESFIIDIRQTPTHLFAIVKSEERGIKDVIYATLDPSKIASTELAASYILAHDKHYFGFIYRCDDPLKQWQFSQALRSALSNSQGAPPLSYSATAHHSLE